MFTVHMVGLMYFHGCTLDVKQALVPNGIRPQTRMPPHYASLFVSADDCEADDWWPDQKTEHPLTVVNDQGDEIKVRVVEFRIPEPAQVLFPDEGDPQAEFMNLEETLPKLETIERRYEVDLEHADTICRVPIRRGALKAYGFNRAAIVQWRVQGHSGPITIAAVTDQVTKSVTLTQKTERLGTEIVFSNTSNLISPSDDLDADRDHFQLYSVLGREAWSANLIPPTAPPKGLTPLPFDHAYLKFLSARTEVPEPGCVPSCC